MKKILILLIVLTISISLVFAATSIKEKIDKESGKCINNCSVEKQENRAECITTYSEGFNDCKANYRQCTNSAKENSANRKEFSKNKENCRVEYFNCRKARQNEKKSCIISVISDFYQCGTECNEREEYCLTLNQPVCGIDSMTYPNDCVLELSNITKACDGKCPCKSDFCWSDDNCNEKQFCEFEGCAAETGKCTIAPEICYDLYEPVCGCDGRTYSNDCEIKRARVSKAYDGTCTIDCTSAGKNMPVYPGYVCCEGLKPISTAIAGSDGKCIQALGTVICSACGNNICEEWENICNCPKDCKKPFCGNGICEEGENLIVCAECPLDCVNMDCAPNCGGCREICPQDCSNS
jgi:hypothetical protein